jgi:hypothetical protein
MAGETGEERLHGRPIGDWIGRIADDVPALVAGVHGHGIARLVRTSLRPTGRAAVDVDVSAALLTEGDQECFGFTVRQRADPVPSVQGDARRTHLLASLAGIESDLGGLAATAALERGRRLLDQYLAQIALERNGGDMARAASALGLAPAELRTLLENPNRDEQPASPDSLATPARA